jgi:uncharacterized protein YbjT (DUF2867 family)
MNMIETILVTGATGNVGSEVIKQLVAPSFSSSGHNHVRAAFHSQNKVDKLKKDIKEVEFVNIDYDKTETIVDALSNVNKIFLVVNPGPRRPISSCIVKEAKKNEVKHIVMLSSMAVDVEPEIAIGRLHRQEEKIIEDSEIPYTFLRPTAFMQNFINFYGHMIQNQSAFYLPAGDRKVSFVDARDIAAVAVQALTRNGSRHANKVYDITGEEALSFTQAAEVISKAVGREISYKEITDEEARKGMKKMGMENWLIDAMMEGFYSIRAGYASRTTTVVEQITGRKSISFSQFVKDYVQAFK